MNLLQILEMVKILKHILTMSSNLRKIDSSCFSNTSFISSVLIDTMFFEESVHHKTRMQHFA